MKIDWDHLANEKDRLEHFASLAECKSYMWINRKGVAVDLRRLSYSHLCKIRDWMLKNSYRDTQYDGTPQFRVVTRRIEAKDRMYQFAREVLKSHAGNDTRLKRGSDRLHDEAAGHQQTDRRDQE